MKTNKTFGLMITAMLILSMGMISASIQGTLVGGTIYTDVNSNGVYDVAIDTPVEGANVDVACTHDGITSHQYDVSQSSGTYGVDFSISQCSMNDQLSVVATKNGVSSDPISGSVTDYVIKWDVGIVDVPFPVVPEFGIAVGAMTILSAVGIFFFVRRK